MLPLRRGKPRDKPLQARAPPADYLLDLTSATRREVIPEPLRQQVRDRDADTSISSNNIAQFGLRRCQGIQNRIAD